MTTLSVLLKAALKELFNNLDHAASHETRDFWVRDEDFAQSFSLNRLHNIYWWVNISTGRTQLLLMPQHVSDLGSADGETQCLSGIVKILGSTRLHLLSGVHVTHTHTHTGANTSERAQVELWRYARSSAVAGSGCCSQPAQRCFYGTGITHPSKMCLNDFKPHIKSNIMIMVRRKLSFWLQNTGGRGTIRLHQTHIPLKEAIVLPPLSVLEFFQS